MSTPRQWGARSLHDTIREELLNRIEGGVYAAGEAIPSVATLSDDFSVSPITIKRAVRDLQAMGFLSTVAGKGTFVKSLKRFNLELDAVNSPFDEATVRLLTVNREKIRISAMSELDPPAEPMLCIRKLIYFGEPEPAIYDSTYVSSDLDDKIIDEFSDGLVSDALKRHKINVVKKSHVIDAVPASGEAVDLFGVPNGYPMLRRMYRFSTDAPGVTIYGVLQAPFDRLACSINVHGEI